LDAELLLYESCHALRLAIASIFTTAVARSRDRKKRVVDYIFRDPEISSATDAADDESTGTA
jgi:hypothetical protein